MSQQQQPVLEGAAAFKHAHYGEEVQDFLLNRATAEEAARVKRCLGIIQRATAAGTSSTSALHAKQQRMSMSMSSTDAKADSSAHSTGNSWLHTATAAAQHRMHGSSSRGGSGGAAVRVQSATSPKHTIASQRSAARPASAAASDTTTAHKQHSNTSSSAKSSVNITTSQAMHGLKDLYPDLWASTVPICRPDPAPNNNFISAWGESLRQGAGEAWAPYLATTSQLANLQVAKPTDEFAVRADEALIGWVAKQHTPFAGLLTPQAEAAVAALLEGGSSSSNASSSSGGAGVLSLSERKELLGVLRQLAAVVQPDRAKSTSHVHHCKQTSVEQPASTALLKEQTRIRTMGAQRKVQVKGFNRPLSTAAAQAAALHNDGGTAEATGGSSDASAAAAAGSLMVVGGRNNNNNNGSSSSSRPQKHHRAVRASEMIDTQKSKVPLKWAASSLVPPCSTYTAAHGAHPGRSPQMIRTKFREVNVGMGHVDQELYPTSSCVYPVEALYLSLPARCQAQVPDVKTTYRASFVGTATAGTAAKAGAAAAANAESTL